MASPFGDQQGSDSSVLVFVFALAAIVVLGVAVAVGYLIATRGSGQETAGIGDRPPTQGEGVAVAGGPNEVDTTTEPPGDGDDGLAAEPAGEHQLVTISSADGPYPSCASPTVEPADRFYVVEPGDFISQISRTEYESDSPDLYRAIFSETNRRAAAGEVAPNGAPYSTIERIDLVFPGNVLYLPTMGEAERLGSAGRVTVPPLDDTSSSDNVRVGGSSTVFPISERVAECFVEAGYRGSVSVSSDGTLGGTALLCGGELDLLDASVALDAGDLAAECRYGLDDLARLHVGYDSVVVAVSRDNPWLGENPDLDPAGLVALLAEAGSWGELAGDGSGEPIARYYPGEGSGTLQFVADRLAAPLAAASGVVDSCDGAPLDREDDLALAACAAADPDGVAILPYAAYRALESELRLVAIDGQVPLPESTEVEESRRYDLFRELYLYVPTGDVAGNPELSAYLATYLATVDQLAISQDLFPLSADDLAATEAAYCEIAGARCDGS